MRNLLQDAFSMDNLKMFGVMLMVFLVVLGFEYQLLMAIAAGRI